MIRNVKTAFGDLTVNQRVTVMGEVATRSLGNVFVLQGKPAQIAKTHVQTVSLE